MAEFDQYVAEDEYDGIAGRDSDHAYEEVLKFDAAAYSARFPAMRISEHSDPIDCRLECTQWSLQILIDTFGNVLQVRKSGKSHGKDELDYNGRPQTFIEVEIKDVEFENIRDFCLAHPEYIMPVAPRKLVRAVKEKLEMILKKYE